LDWLGLAVEQLRQQPRRLRVSASFHDVLGEFYDVIRHAKPEAWTSLRGEARTAMDSPARWLHQRTCLNREYALVT
jgi:hypothetical protein